jgi:hypothetical protein
VRFSEKSDQLRFVSNILLEHVARPFFVNDVEEYARSYPFQYTPEDLSNLQQFIFPGPLDRELRLWGLADRWNIPRRTFFVHPG